MSEAAVAAAATDSSRDSIAAWSSSRRRGDRLLRSELVMFRMPLSGLKDGIMDDVRPSLLAGLTRGTCVSAGPLLAAFASSSKLMSSSGTCRLGRKGPRSWPDPPGVRSVAREVEGKERVEEEV
jgi:hypothetical protein